MRKPKKKPIIVRLATAEDIPAIVDMVEAATRENESMDNLAEFNSETVSGVVDILINDSKHAAFVAENSKLVGSIFLTSVPVWYGLGETVAQAFSWVVAPDYRKRGVGGMLAKEAEKWAESIGARVLSLTALRGANGLAGRLLKNGFRLQESCYFKGVE